MISQRDFNKNLDSYISGMRIKEEIIGKPNKEKKKVEENVNFESYGEEGVPKQKKSFFSWLKSSPNVNEEDFSEGVNVNLDEEGNLLQESINETSSSKTKSVVQEMAEEYEELDQVEKKIEKRKTSLFARLFKRTSSLKRESDFDDGIEIYDEQKDADQIINLKDDIKKLGIITYEVMRKIDPEELKRFKLSEEFSDYKEILKKHNLIRVKF